LLRQQAVEQQHPHLQQQLHGLLGVVGRHFVRLNMNISNIITGVVISAQTIEINI
jgi:hypothetical protein